MAIRGDKLFEEQVEDIEHTEFDAPRGYPYRKFPFLGKFYPSPPPVRILHKEKGQIYTGCPHSTDLPLPLECAQPRSQKSFPARTK